MLAAVIEFSERLSYFGLATNLIIYLTRVLHQEVKTAAKNVNYWQGVTTLVPLFGGFIADAYLGRFSTVLCSSVIYILVSPASLFHFHLYVTLCICEVQILCKFSTSRTIVF